MSSLAGELRPLNPAEYAPIRHPFIIAWFYPRGAPSESDTYESDYLNILTSNYGSFNAWAEIGVLPLQQIGWRYARLDRLKTRAEAGQAGVVFDELLRTDEDSPENWNRFAACREVKIEYPDYYVGIHGNTISRSLMDAFEDGAIDHFYEESYTSSYHDRPDYAVSPTGIRHRWKMYRAAGIIDRVVWHFGCLEEDPDTYFHKGFTPTRLEYEMQLARRWAPEKAGVCFYTWAIRRPDSPLFTAIDRLVYEYYLRPAPPVELEIMPGLDQTATVTVQAGESTFGGKPVSVNIFLDTKKVAEADNWNWDFSEKTDGEYLLTAHATTEDYYHGATQVAVTLQNGSITDQNERPDERPVRKPMERLGPAGGGEPTHALAVRDGIVYIGVGTSLRVLDFSANWRRIGSYVTVPQLELPGQPERFALAGDELYAACGEAGLVIVDIADMENPRIIGRYNEIDRAEDVFPLDDDLLLIAAGTDGLVILDTSGPTVAKIGDYPFEYAWSVIAGEGVAYVTAGMEGLVLVDITDPPAPRLLAAKQTGDWALRVAIDGDIAAVADWKGGVRIIDISDSTAPEELGRHRMPWVWDVAIKDNIVYFADENFGLRAFDYTAPETLAHPEGRWSDGSVVLWDKTETGDALNVVIDGDQVFTVDGWLGLRMFDVGQGPRNARGSILYPIKSVWNVWIKGVRPFNE